MKRLVLGITTLLGLTLSPVIASAQVDTTYQANGYEQQYVDPSQQQYVDPSQQQYVDPSQQQYVDPSQQQYVDPSQTQVQYSAYAYLGAHPVPHDQGGGFCQEGSAHQHTYPVFDTHLFRDVNGYAQFVGDPADFGYQSPGYMYSGHHPLDAAQGGGYCYMGWAHRHTFAPVATTYVMQAGAYVYNGGWGPDYYSSRPLYSNYFDGYYRRHYYGGQYFVRRPSHVYTGWGWGRAWRPGWQRPVVRYAPPVYRSPVYRAPAYRAPVYRAPVYQSPVYRAPVYRSPVYRAPVYNAPTRVAPSYGGGGGGHFGGHGRRW